MSTGQSTVTYKPVPGFPGYRVGDDGSVWSCLKRSGAGKGNRGSRVIPGEQWKQLKPGTRKDRRRHVILRRTTFLVHHIVLLAFVGPCPEGMEACHADDNPNNNALSNLRWDTPTANIADRIRNDRQVRGERHGMSKLTADIVRSIRSEYATGTTTQARLAEKHDLSLGAVSKLVRRERWAHVS